MENDQRVLLKAITSLLGKYKIPYMITGAWSVIYYGRPRASHDIDFVVELFKSDIPRISEAMRSLSPDFSYESHVIREAIEKRGIFQVLYLPTYLKMDFWLLKQDSFDLSRFGRRKKVMLLDQPMFIASSEDTILQKLRWYKQAKIEKHIVDAAFVYQIQKKNLDRGYISRWAKKLSVSKYIGQLRKIDLEKYL